MELEEAHFVEDKCFPESFCQERIRFDSPFKNGMLILRIALENLGAQQ